MSENFYLPRNDEHVTIVGRNGTGKTFMGGWLLSKQDLKNNIWVMIDYKGDELLNAITRARVIENWEIPSKPGLFILHSRPDLEDETEAWLWKLYSRENVGLYIDEGYMLPQIERGSFQALLTQGRSKRIPVITLSQRPVKVNRFAFSEASHLVVFDLSDQRDLRTVAEMVPAKFLRYVPHGLDARADPYDTDQLLLPKFHARWWSVKRRAGWIMRPVPSADEIISAIDAQLEPRKRWL